MKKTVNIVIMSFLWMCVACSQRSNDTSIEQSMHECYNPFAIEGSKTELFAEIDTKIDSVISADAINYDKFTIRGYMIWDSIANALYSPDKFLHTSDWDWARHRNGVVEYLNYHLNNTIDSILQNQQIINARKRENQLTDSLLTTQYKWVRAHFDTTEEYLGSSSQLKYYNIEEEMLKVQNVNLQDLLIALTDSMHYKRSSHSISNNMLQKEYQHITFDRIPYYQNDTVYNESDDRLIFKTEIKAWDSLMKHRSNVSILLMDNAREAYNYGTYRLLFNRLRQLKNEFEAYDIMSSDMRGLMLSDSCTYEELMSYPNYSTKWGEYLKEFER